MKFKDDMHEEQGVGINEAETPEVETVVSSRSSKPTYIDVKDGDGDAFLDPDEYVYLSDGVYIHKDECWF
ncbi:hypothetical protein [Vibrio breoganii]|uniref:hypothetical protein n=1 Tax=Vibrio breoganii TaxID=553239 RepID=UPI000C84A19C|nr:hypothetical protein [Vibrio breoganii]PMG90604.1 hypothetical protein BCU79_17850 [Vibrio breoganii]